MVEQDGAPQTSRALRQIRSAQPRQVIKIPSGHVAMLDDLPTDGIPCST
jgi:hypothetical protein